MKELHLKYRPATWGDVVGQQALVSSLQKSIERKSSRAFLLCGPSGTGKTTLARIGAAALGATSATIREIDAATHGGVDDMRALTEQIRYKPLGKTAHLAIVIDECHTLSKSAWDALLKAVEEPPSHVSWWFCTTAASKVPVTIKTRCATYNLKPVADGILGELYDKVCEAEGIDLPEDVANLIIRQAEGSPRQMLVNLNVCRDAKNKKRAAELLEAVLSSDPVLELARFVVKGGSWRACMALMDKLPEAQNPEGVRIILVNYIGAVLKGAKSDQEACRVLALLEAFAQPYNSAERLSPLLLSIGRALYSGGD